MNKVAFIVLLVCLHTLYASVIKGPYLLYEGENSAMTLLWQLSEPLESEVRWGETESHELGRASGEGFGSDNQYRYTITGLEPGTTYYYTISGVGTGSFRAAPAQSSASVKLFAYGDTRSNPTKHNAVCQEMVNRYSYDTTYQTAVLFSGDYVSQGGSESDWNEQFFPRKSGIMELQANLPIVGAIGNHEGERPGGTDVMKKYYPFPYVTKDGFYWACDYGPVRVLFVDQFTTSYAPGSPQYNWLKSELAAVTKEWVVIVLHSPGYSAGGGHENDMNVQNYLQPLCEEYDVDFVLTGDNHYYARADVNGVQHITTGGGGAPLYAPDLTYPHIVKADKSYHYCEFDFQGTNCVVTVRRAGGTVVEEFTRRHEESKVPAIYIGSPGADTTIGVGDPLAIEVYAPLYKDEVSSVELLVNGAPYDEAGIPPFQFEFSSETPDTVEIVARAVVEDSTHASKPLLISIIDSSEHEFTLLRRVAQSSDDAEEHLADGRVDDNSSDLEFVEDPKFGDQIVGVRFSGIELPENADIRGAWIQYTVDEPSSGDVTYQIYGEKSASSTSFQEHAYNISSRAKTKAFVQWFPENWDVGKESTEKQMTPNLAPIVKEIRDLSGWDGTLTFLLSAEHKSGAKRVAASYDGGIADAPQLLVKYKLDHKTAVVSSTGAGTIPEISVAPNPLLVGEECHFYVEQSLLSEYDSIEMVILTSLGVPVHYSKSALPLTENHLIWDGTNINGRIVSSGTYLACLQLQKRDGERVIFTVPIGVRE